MKLKKTTLNALMLVILLLPVVATADCDLNKEKLGPGEWLVEQAGNWPATIQTTDEFERGLQLVVRGQVCDAEGKAIPGAGLRLVRFEPLEGAEMPNPTFADLEQDGNDNFRVFDPITGKADDTGNVRAAVKPGRYALIPLDANQNRIDGRLFFSLRVIQGFATAHTYGDIAGSD